MKVEFYNNGDVEVHVSPDTPALLGDKIVNLIKDFYKNRK